MGLLAAAIAMATLAPPAVAEDGGPETRVFTLRWRSLPDAGLLARPPLLSADAVIQMEPKLSSLTVTDWPSNLEALESALASFDVPPRAVDVVVVLVRATSTSAAKPIGDELRSIKDSVDPVAAFSSYEVVGEARLSGVEGGGDVSALIGDDLYRVAFRIGAVDDRNAIVRLDDLSLRKKRRGAPGAATPAAPVYDDVMTLTYNAPNAQRVVLGVTRAQARESAVLLLIEAVIRPVPGITTDVAGRAPDGDGERSR